MSPYQLEILLSVYCGSPVGADKQAPIFQETVNELQMAGWMIKRENAHVEYAPTAKLRIFIEHVLDLPEPVQAWRMP
jgi:hypothetical protein